MADWTNYWARARFYYFRDHENSGAWGVHDGRTEQVRAVGMDKNDAAAFACFLNGDIEHAREILAVR